MYQMHAYQKKYFFKNVALLYLKTKNVLNV